MNRHLHLLIDFIMFQICRSRCDGEISFKKMKCETVVISILRVLNQRISKEKTINLIESWEKDVEYAGPIYLKGPHPAIILSDTTT